MQKFKTILILMVIFCCTIAMIHEASYSLQNNSSMTTVISKTNYEVGTITRVVDGDTLLINISGEDKYVRLIGIDTPESVSSDTSKNCVEGTIASDYTKSLVAVGQAVWLQKDTSDTDRYNRLLRYVWLEKPVSSDNYDTMLNYILVRDGYAQAKEYPPDTKYSNLFDSAGNVAIKDNLGITGKWK